MPRPFARAVAYSLCPFRCCIYPNLPIFFFGERHQVSLYVARVAGVKHKSLVNKKYLSLYK